MKTKVSVPAEVREQQRASARARWDKTTPGERAEFARRIWAKRCANAALRLVAARSLPE